MENKTEAALRSKIDALMTAGVSANLDALKKIYHDDLNIIYLSIDGQMMTFDKAECLALIEQTFEGKKPEEHMWAKIHLVTVTGDRGHVLISRKLPFGGAMMMIDLSIDLVFEDDRWQVIREVNFARPDTEAA